jgi:hypothetical protein
MSKNDTFSGLLDLLHNWHIQFNPTESLKNQIATLGYCTLILKPALSWILCQWLVGESHLSIATLNTIVAHWVSQYADSEVEIWYHKLVRVYSGNHWGGERNKTGQREIWTVMSAGPTINNLSQLSKVGTLGQVWTVSQSPIIVSSYH